MLAVFSVWILVGVVALSARRELMLMVVGAVLYSIAMPFLLRYLYRDIDCRVVPDGASEGMARLAQETGLASGAGASTQGR